MMPHQVAPYARRKNVTLTTRRQFSVHDYARMRESGILTEDDRVELLAGEIIVLSPIGPFHVGVVNKLNKLLGNLVGDTGIISVQNPVHLNDYGEPQPDLAILHPRDDFYVDALATPDDILLLIEVADSSLGYDRDEKLPQYAASSISEVWIIDVQNRVVEQYTQPAQGQYTQIHKVLYGSTITATTMVNVQFTTDRIF
jgi:Uma2 family endonuclease